MREPGLRQRRRGETQAGKEVHNGLEPKAVMLMNAGGDPGEARGPFFPG